MYGEAYRPSLTEKDFSRNLNLVKLSCSEIPSNAPAASEATFGDIFTNK